MPADAPIDPYESAWALRMRDPAGFAEAVAALPEGPVTAYLEARLALSAGRLDECLVLCRAADADLPPESVWAARLAETQGNALNHLGLGAEAQRMLQIAWDRYAALDDAVGLASVRQNVATLSFQSPEKAYELYEEALVAARAVGQDDLCGVILLNLEGLSIELRRPLDHRRRLAREAHDILADTWPRMAILARCVQVAQEIEADNLDAAAALAADLPPAEEVVDRSVRASMARSIARLHLARGDAARAVEVLEEVADIGLQGDDQIEVDRLLSTALERSGRLPEAFSALQRAYERLDVLRFDDMDTAARALDVWHRTRRLVEQRELEVRRADRLQRALADLETATARIHELSIRDPLTGAHNRMYLMDAGTRLLASARGPVEVALVDLDRFKSINDTYGHPAGDAVLVGFVQTLRAHLPASDLVARYGGEEFVVVRDCSVRPVPLCHDLDALRHVLAERTVTGPDGEQLPTVTMSVGVARVAGPRAASAASAAATPDRVQPRGLPDAHLPGAEPTDDLSTEALTRLLSVALGRADRLMYAAKTVGRDRVRCAEHDDAGATTLRQMPCLTTLVPEDAAQHDAVQ